MNPARVQPRPTSAAVEPLDVERVRDDFPALHQRVYGKPLVYLDSAATMLKPRCVIDAVERVYARDCANVHRGVHLLSQRATEAYEQSRSRVRSFLGAARDSEIVFVRGTTEAINLVAHSFGRRRISRGDEILITGMEHHSNIVPWQLLCEEVDAKLVVVPISDRGEVNLGEFESLLSARTRLVSVVHVSNALGTVNPVREMVKLAHARDVPVLLDGAQAVAHQRVDVTEIGCDFYAFSGHKLCGPTGVGVLYGRQEYLKEMPPYQGGGEMIRRVTFEKTTYADPPTRFEAGTPNIAGVVGLGAAVDYVGRLSLGAIREYEVDLLDYATKKVSEIPGLRIVGTAEEKSGVISFVIEGIHPHDIGSIVDREGIAIRTGHHCAQPVMDRFGLPATSRASLAFYNTRDEVDALVGALVKVKEFFA